VIDPASAGYFFILIFGENIMFHTQGMGFASVVTPTSTATTATTTGVLDTLGYEDVSIGILLNSQAATSSNPATLKLSESDDLTNYTDVTAFVGDATDGFTIPAMSASVATPVQWNVDCRARKRYLMVTITPAGTTQIVAAGAMLGKAKDMTAALAVAGVVVTG
jgi:hypothetical protein